MFGTSLYWRETHKQPRFLIFDGRLVILFLIVILHVRLWTISLALLAMLVLFLFDRRGVPADSILRYLRSGLLGRYRSAQGKSAERMAIDFGFETAPVVNRAAKAHEAMARARAKRPGGGSKRGLMSILGGSND